MQKIHSVKYNFIMNFILTASQFLFPLITFPYVSRVLHAAGNGKVSFAASVANYFILVASLGIPTYGVRACARVRDNKEKLTQTVQEIFIINSISTLLVTATYLICVWTIPKLSEESMLFYINCINIVLNMFGMNWVYQALEQYDYITARSVAFKIVSVVLMFLMVHQESDYVIYAAITVLAAVGSYALNFVRLRHIIEFKKCDTYRLKRHLRPIFILFAQSMAVSIYTNLDTVMLGFLKTDIDVGYYNAAIKIKGILLSLVSSLGNVLLPRMSYYVKNNMMDKFKLYLTKALNFELLMSIALSLYFVLFARESILLLAGDGYEGAVLAMQIVTISVIPNGLTGILGIQVLTSLEKEKYVLYSVVAGAGIDFVLNCFLIPAESATGAAIATTVAEFLVLVIQAMYTKALLREVRSQIRVHYYIALSLVAGLGSWCIKLLDVALFPTLLLSAVAFFGIYGCGLLIVKEPIVTDTLNGLKLKLVSRDG